MSFKNKVVLVTGAASGIGAAVAIAFCKESADVVMVDRNQTRLTAVEQKCMIHGKAPLIINADVSKDEDVKKVVETTIEKFKKIDILINNAGILRAGTITDGKFIRAFDEVIATNLRGSILLTSLASPHLIRAKGNIINMSSTLAKIVMPQLLSYGISKAALDYFTLGAAVELAAHGVRVNAISPGPVYTNILEKSGLSEDVDPFKAVTLLDKVAEPEEIAEIVLFLASDKAKSVTGANYSCDNGMYLKR